MNEYENYENEDDSNIESWAGGELSGPVVETGYTPHDEKFEELYGFRPGDAIDFD